MTDHALPPGQPHLLAPPRLCEDGEHKVAYIGLVFEEVDVHLQGGIHRE